MPSKRSLYLFCVSVFARLWSIVHNTLNRVINFNLAINPAENAPVIKKEFLTLIASRPDIGSCTLLRAPVALKLAMHKAFHVEELDNDDLEIQAAPCEVLNVIPKYFDNVDIQACFSSKFYGLIITWILKCESKVK